LAPSWRSVPQFAYLTTKSPKRLILFAEAIARCLAFADALDARFLPP
jgi:hypothetical protein